MSQELPQEWVDQLTLKTGEIMQMGADIYNAGYDAGVASVDVQAQIDQAVALAVAAKVQEFVDWYAVYDTAQDEAFDNLVAPPAG